MSSVNRWLTGWMLRALGGLGLKNLGPCHLYLMCPSYKSVTRDICSKQIYYDRQRKLYKAHCCMFPGKLVKVWLNMWFISLLNILGMAFLLNFDAFCSNHGLVWPAILLFYSVSAFFWYAVFLMCCFELKKQLRSSHPTKKSVWKKSGKLCRGLQCTHVRNTYMLPFESEVGCFKGVVVCLSCIWTFLVLIVFF